MAKVTKFSLLYKTTLKLIFLISTYLYYERPLTKPRPVYPSPRTRHRVRDEAGLASRTRSQSLMWFIYLVGLGRISGSAGLSGRIFHFAWYPAKLSGRIFHFAGLSGRIWQALDIRHLARNTRSGPTLLDTLIFRTCDFWQWGLTGPIGHPHPQMLAHVLSPIAFTVPIYLLTLIL